jgi:predicted DNA binding CopG/RHH family protein
MPDSHIKPRKIIGVSLSPELAVAVKAEAASRGLSLRKLFEEMWDLYQAAKKST